MKFNARLTTLLCASLLAGCGGGGSSSSTSTEPTEPAGAPFEFGNISGRAAATNPPLSTNSASIIATSLTGLITSLRLRDQQLNIVEGRVLFVSRMESTNNEIYSTNLDGTDLVRITNTPGINELAPSVSPDGNRIAFQAVGTGGEMEIFVMNIDGSGRVQVTDNAVLDALPRWAPTGTSVVFQSGTSIAMVNVATRALTTLVEDSFVSGAPDFSADGQRVVFHSFNREANSRFHLYEVPAAGGSVQNFFINLPTDQTFPKLSPDGLKLLYSDSSSTTLRYRTFGGSSNVDGPDADSTDYNWSPDSQWVVYNKFGSDGIDALFVSRPDGTDEFEVAPDLRTDKNDPSFIPAPREVLFVGPGSLFGSRLAGFIFSQSGDNVRALLGFDAVTPSSVVVTRQTPSDTISPNLVYSIDADTLNEIAYAHAPYWERIRVVGGGTGLAAADGALVSINSATGKVAAVLPFAGARSRAYFEEQGGTQVFTGEFLGVFDASGKNLGPASEVRLDVESGTLSVGG